MTRETNISEYPNFTRHGVYKTCETVLADESPRVRAAGDKFIKYFFRNARPDGVLFRTGAELKEDLRLDHRTLLKVTRLLEREGIIYKRNGIIGLLKD